MKTYTLRMPKMSRWLTAAPACLLWALVIWSMRNLAVPSSRASTPPSDPPSAPKAYVGLFKDNSIAVLDLVDNRVLRTISIPPGPHGLVMTHDGRKVYVSSDGASTVSVIDTRTDQVVASIEVGPNPHGLAMSPDGRRVLVSAFGANQAMFLDTTSDKIIGQITVPLPHNGAISSDGKTAYVGSQQQGATALVVLDLINMKEASKVALDKTPRGLDLSPDGRWLSFTVAGVNAVRVLDTQTNQIVGEIPTGASPHVAVFAPKGDKAMAVSQGPGELEVFDLAQRAVSGTVKVGQTPHWLAVSTDGRIAFVTNEGSDDVTVVDVEQRRVLATIPVGKAPRKIAVQPGASIPPSTPGQRSGKVETYGHAEHGSDVRGQTVTTVMADDYYFAPTLLRSEPGQVLRLVVENSSGTLHNISVPALQIDQDILPKGSVNVQVSLPPSGVFPFFCKLHEALGMHGRLIVEAVRPSVTDALIGCRVRAQAAPGHAASVLLREVASCSLHAHLTYSSLLCHLVIWTKLANLVVLTGDVHNHWAGELKTDFDDPSSATLGVEFMATSIAFGGDGFDMDDSFSALL